MTRLATIVLATFMLAAPAVVQSASAASGVDAIKAWIAAVPGDWSVTYKSLTYDQPTDKTTLGGLSATDANLNVTVNFNAIVLGGYTTAPDGSFSAASLSVGTGTATSDKVRLAISGISATDFGSAPMTPVAYDPDHPFTSLVAMYENVVKVQVGHASVNSVLMKDDSNGSSFTYNGFAVDNWQNGKIGSMTTGTIDVGFVDDNGDPGDIHIGGFSSHDTDLDAILRVYDPARYANGVGDVMWRPAIGSAEYHDLTISSTDFKATVGAWEVDNMQVRQPAHSFAEVFDTAASGNDSSDDDMHAALDMWSAFSFGKFAVTNAMVNTGDGSGSLGAFTMTDFSSEGLGEVSLDNLNVTAPEGFVKAGHLAVGGVVFPGADKIAAAYDASQTGQDVDYSSLRAQLGYIEASALDVLSPLAPETKLDKLRLDLSNYVGVVPTSVALDIAGFDAPAELFDQDGTDTTLQDLDYDRVHADAGLKLTWNEKDQTVTLGDLHVSLANVGNITATAVFGGLSRDALSSVDTLPDALEQLTLNKSSVTIEDKSLFSRFLAQQAYEMGIDQEDFRQQLIAMIPDVVSDIGDKAFQTKLAAALTTFIQRPGTLTVTANPPQPQPAAGLGLLASIFPETLPSTVGLDVSATPGPAPTPFNFVPPPDLTTPDLTPPDLTAPDQTGPDANHQHVARKKT